jgi:hypothetical protein
MIFAFELYDFKSSLNFLTSSLVRTKEIAIYSGFFETQNSKSSKSFFVNGSTDKEAVEVFTHLFEDKVQLFKISIYRVLSPLFSKTFAERYPSLKSKISHIFKSVIK